MATGDVTMFDQAMVDIGLKLHDLNADTLYIAFINNTSPPTAADPVPHWNGTGTTNHQANAVSGGNFPANGEDITNTFTLDTGVGVLDGADLTWAQNASNPTTIYWGIIYNFTNVAKQCIAFVEMGGPVSGVAGQVQLNWAATGILRFDQA